MSSCFEEAAHATEVELRDCDGAGTLHRQRA